ncbi:hypothetical protein FB45DRAFT_1065305 [Roridomyces roridus]|uniref:Pheromone n=1 Tax=Roridomyces roridus TaxID=1738132 RepID=A0AAD7B6W6_9AGAR|nr:hypothetical protein FB45DRAFT_1065305 [Roridomyces roridus]
MDAFTITTIPSKTEESILPPVSDDSSSGTSGQCVVLRADTFELQPVNSDDGSGTSSSGGLSTIGSAGMCIVA